MTDAGSAPPQPYDDGSLRRRLAARRAELRAERPFDLDVPGYGGEVRARYRALDYETIRKIGLKQENNHHQAERELYIAADTLVAACVCLLFVEDDGSVTETRFRWDEESARELFGVSEEELPEGSIGRHAIMRIIPNTATLMKHYFQYDQSVGGVERDATGAMAGESEAGSEPA